MSPRPGGESDKIPNRYEGAWTVKRLLDVLAGHVDWVRIEPLGELGRGVEFVLRRRDGSVEAHQVKRQFGDANEWNVGALNRLGIWETAKRKSDAGHEFHFVSMVPFRRLQELTERTRNSDDYASFIRGSLPRGLDDLFTQISDLYPNPEAAYRILRRFYVRLIDEAELRKDNAVIADLLLEGGAGRQASASLGEVVDDNIDVKLTADRILEALIPHELRRRLAINKLGLASTVRAETTAWLERVGRQLINPTIPRQEAEQLRGLPAQAELVHFLVGAAGSGKTAVLHQAVTGLVADSVPTMVVRLDRFGTLPTTVELGRQLGLDVSPVTALAAAADGRPAVLVVDQLDAVSLASGRLPENFDIVADLITEAAAIPGLHVLLGCRQFDIDNDHRIRSLRDRLKATVLSVAPLTDEQIAAAVSAMELSASTLTRQQQEILRLPLHLALLATVANEPGALDFVNSQRLFDAYWKHKRQAARSRRESVRFGEVVARLAEAISERQELAVPISIFDEDLAEHVGVLVSEQLLIQDGQKIAFFHEAVFDYAFARQWVNRGESIVDFLARGEQELFRRGQVRQIMTHLRGSDPGRFIDEVSALLTSDQIRFHIKAAALSVLGGIGDPTTAEADMLLSIAAGHPVYEARLWRQLDVPAWFTRLDIDGHIEDWLRADVELQDRALQLMASAAKTSPDRLAEILSQHRDVAKYPEWLRWVVRFAELAASRRLFDLFLDAIRLRQFDGFEYELWLAAQDLADKQPDLAVEALAAFLIDRPGGLERTEDGLDDLESDEYLAAELVRKAAAGAPRQFCDLLLPYLLRVIEVTATVRVASTRTHEEKWQGLQQDAQFSHRYPVSESNTDFDDQLFVGMASAIRALTTAEPAAMRPILERLATDLYDSAQWLLYQGLMAGGAAYADWSAELLLEGRHRFLCGYGWNESWMARQVIQAISPHISDELFGRLEAEVRDLRFPWEYHRPAWSAFNLLSAMDEGRLSEVGRRRLGELRRAVGMDQPSEPQVLEGGSIGPPIASDAALHMSDDNWLRAMAKHAGERGDITTLKGGAHQQAQVLREQTQQDPSRFARLALRLSADTNTSYGDAILMGLGDADPVADQALVLDAVRHLASFGHSEHDRWLGSALRPYLKTLPPEGVELVRDRILATTDPSDDGARVWRVVDRGRRRTDIVTSGINMARGSLAETLAALVSYDVDGVRTALAVSVLDRLAEDPSVPVRTCAARLIEAVLRHDRPAATAAFWRLIETDDVLLATEPVMRLLYLLGNEDHTAVEPVIARMLASSDADVREAGGQLAALAAMEWGIEDRLKAVLIGADAAACKGAAGMAAHRLAHTAHPDAAASTLAALVNDPNDDVRKHTAEVAVALRGHALRPFESVLKTILASPAFTDAVPQMLITLERAPDRVDDLALFFAQRFVDALGKDAADIRTSAAGDARDVSKLVVRGLAQSHTPDGRAALLDVLDQLFLIGVYGIDDVVSESER